MGNYGNMQDEYSHLIKKYNIKQHPERQDLWILENKQSSQVLILKQQQFTKKNKDYHQCIRELKQRQNSPNQNYLSLICNQLSLEYHIIHQQSLVIYAIYQYASLSLYQEIHSRKTQNRPFEEKELWSIFCSIALGLSSIAKIQQCHGQISPVNIFITQEGMIKLADPNICCNQKNNFDNLGYVAPQILYSLEANKKIEEFNSIKSDIFSIGLTMMDAALLDQNHEVYDYDNFEVNYFLIEQKIMKICDQYSESFASLIASMVIENFQERPSLQDLQQNIKRLMQKMENCVREKKEVLNNPAKHLFRDVLDKQNYFDQFKGPEQKFEADQNQFDKSNNQQSKPLIEVDNCKKIPDKKEHQKKKKMIEAEETKEHTQKNILQKRMNYNLQLDNKYKNKEKYSEAKNNITSIGNQNYQVPSSKKIINYGQSDIYKNKFRQQTNIKEQIKKIHNEKVVNMSINEICSYNPDTYFNNQKLKNYHQSNVKTEEKIYLKQQKQIKMQGKINQVNQNIHIKKNFINFDSTYAPPNKYLQTPSTQISNNYLTNFKYCNPQQKNYELIYNSSFNQNTDINSNITSPNIIYKNNKQNDKEQIYTDPNLLEMIRKDLKILQQKSKQKQSRLSNLTPNNITNYCMSNKKQQFQNRVNPFQFVEYQDHPSHLI